MSQHVGDDVTSAGVGSGNHEIVSDSAGSSPPSSTSGAADASSAAQANASNSADPQVRATTPAMRRSLLSIGKRSSTSNMSTSASTDFGAAGEDLRDLMKTQHASTGSIPAQSYPASRSPPRDGADAAGGDVTPGAGGSPGGGGSGGNGGSDVSSLSSSGSQPSFVSPRSRGSTSSSVNSGGGVAVGLFDDAMPSAAAASSGVGHWLGLGREQFRLDKGRLPYEDEKAPPAKLDFDTIVDSKLGLECFREFLAYEHSEENLDFYLQAKVFSKKFKGKKVGNAKMIDAANQLYTKFFDEASSTEINVPDEIKREVRERVRKTRANANDKNGIVDKMFNAAIKEVLLTLKRDSFTRFKVSFHAYGFDVAERSTALISMIG